MSKRNENRQGYKKTKVGWIPSDWVPVKLGSCFKLSSGETKPSNISEFPNSQNNIPVYGGNGIMGYTNRVFGDCKCIVIGRVGENCGCVYLVNWQYFITDNALYTKSWQRVSSIEYFAYYLDYFKLSRLRNKGGQPLVSQKPICAVIIPLPPLPEQKKISETLSAWDRAIAQVGKLIEAKERLKKGLMQQLLTGRTRFPELGKPVREKGELPEGWEVKPLGSFGSFSKGKGISNSEKIEAGLPCITYGEIYTKHDFDIKQFFSFINRNTAQNAQRINDGDILFAGSGETLDEIGKCVSYTMDAEAYAGGDIVIFRPKGANPLYLSYSLNSDSSIRQKRKLGQGHSVVHIYSAGLKTLRVPLPSFEEQICIASILTTCDQEIEPLCKKEIVLREQKKGLMQKLLTGEIRHPDFVKE